MPSCQWQWMSLVWFQITCSSSPISYRTRDSACWRYRVIRRQWVKFDEIEFRKDLAKSDLITSPLTNCDEYFACYDDTLRRLLNAHTPLRAKVHRSHPSALTWFNSVCRQAKVKTRQLEKIYRATRSMDQRALMSSRSTVAFRHWCIQTDIRHPTLCVLDGLLKILVKFNKQLFWF